MIKTDYDEEHALATWKSKETVKQRNETFNHTKKLTILNYVYISTALVAIKQTTVDLPSTIQFIHKRRNKRTLQNLSDVRKSLKVGMVYVKQIKYSDPFKKKSDII